MYSVATTCYANATLCLAMGTREGFVIVLFLPLQFGGNGLSFIFLAQLALKPTLFSSVCKV